MNKGKSIIVTREVRNSNTQNIPYCNAIFLRIKNKSAASVQYTLGRGLVTLDVNEEDIFPSYGAPCTGKINFVYGAGAINIKISIIEEINEE